VIVCVIIGEAHPDAVDLPLLAGWTVTPM